MKISARILGIEESKTVQFTPLLNKMRREGKRIFDFAVGEPEFHTPLPIIAATQKALSEQHTRYGPVAGLPELRDALAKAFDGYDGQNIMISNGSKQSLFFIFQVICNPGDEVIVPRPCWVSFSEQIKLAGGIPVFTDTVNHQPDFHAMEKAVTPRTKAILINSPNNPTGAVYTKALMEKVMHLAQDRGICIVSDEAYDQFIYTDDGYKSFFELKKNLDHLILVRSFSKHYNMTGFRIGYAVASEEIVSAMTRFQSHACGNVCSFAQYGALAAVSMDPDLFLQQKDLMEEKRNKAYALAAALFSCIRPEGAFYLFPDISKYLKPGETAVTFAADLLEQTGVAVVPGEAFGMEGHIRISYAVPEDLLVEGFENIARYLKDRVFV